MNGSFGPYLILVIFLVGIGAVGIFTLFKFGGLHERHKRHDSSLTEIDKNLTQVAHGVEGESEASKEIARSMGRVEANVRDIKTILQAQQRHEPRPV